MSDKFKIAARRRELRDQAIQYKGGCCKICGYDVCYAALDFHHIDETTKEYNISARLTSSLEKLKPELDKTVLLCCRCHREVHDGLHPGYLDLGLNYD